MRPSGDKRKRLPAGGIEDRGYPRSTRPIGAILGASCGCQTGKSWRKPPDAPILAILLIAAAKVAISPRSSNLQETNSAARWRRPWDRYSLTIRTIAGGSSEPPGAALKGHDHTQRHRDQGRDDNSRDRKLKHQQRPFASKTFDARQILPSLILAAARQYRFGRRRLGSRPRKMRPSQMAPAC